SRRRPEPFSSLSGGGRGGGAAASHRRFDVLHLAAREIVARDVRVLRRRIEDVEVGWIHRVLEAVAAADAGPHPLAQPALAELLLAHRARPAPRAVVLQADANMIWPTHVRGRVIREAARCWPNRLPRRAGVMRLIEAAVVAVHHVPAVRRIDPDRVVVDV